MGPFRVFQNRAKQVRFQKGQSGNPGGRPRAFKSFRETAVAHMDAKGVRALIDMAEGDGEDRRFALKLLAEYAYGKPQQHVDVTSQGTRIKAVGLTQEEFNQV